MQTDREILQAILDRIMRLETRFMRFMTLIGKDKQVSR